MKKIVAVVLVVTTMVVALCGCGNMSIGIGNYTYEKVHVDTHHYSGCFTIEKWYDSETGIEVKTKEYGSFFLSEGSYVLLGGDEGCPFCNNGKGDTK